MPENQTTILEPEKKQRLLSLLERLLPLVDTLADKLRLLWILGVLVTGWFVVWCYYLKHYSLVASALVGLVAFFPTLILLRFWWAMEELKSLPDIAGQMVGDTKSGLQQSVQNIRAGKTPKLGFLSAGKSLWSVGAMASEALGLMGSSVATLANPVMLILGVTSFVGVILLFFVGVMLAFFV
jgi:hypothetical protein